MFQSPVIRRANVFTWIVVALCIFFTAITQAGKNLDMLSLFVFFPPLMKEGEIWRLITPTFLHFYFLGSSFLHLLFNLLIWLNFGGWIGFVEKSWRLPALFFFTAIVANIAAYWSYGVAFGGLSGVVYGVAAYLWWAGRRVLLYRMILPSQMFYAFVGFLCFGYTGLMGNVANSAHLGGLIAGLLFAMLSPPKLKTLPQQALA